MLAGAPRYVGLVILRRITEMHGGRIWVPVMARRFHSLFPQVKNKWGHHEQVYPCRRRSGG
jgi:hypothetical protein